MHGNIDAYYDRLCVQLTRVFRLNITDYIFSDRNSANMELANMAFNIGRSVAVAAKNLQMKRRVNSNKYIRLKDETGCVVWDTKLWGSTLTEDEKNFIGRRFKRFRMNLDVSPSLSSRSLLNMVSKSLSKTHCLYSNLYNNLDQLKTAV